MIKLAAAYLRVSTDEQAEHGISLPAQKSRLIAYVKAQGWEIYDYYVDDGYSGKDLERPAMKKMIADSQAGKFDNVVVIKLDRLSRRQKDVLHLLEDVFEMRGVGFKSVTEPFDTTTPFGKAAIGMMAVFAQLERETIVERVKMAKKEAAKQGRFGGGDAPYGYTYDMVKKELLVDDITAPTVELIFKLYESGKYGFRSLALNIAERGIAAPSGGVWYKDTVKKILSNPTYAGYIHRCGELTEGKHPTIIERPRWEHVQGMINDNYIPRPTKADANLLAGQIYCGNCGARMRFKTQRWKDPKGSEKVWTREYYICYSRAKYDRMVKDINCKMPFIRAETANKAVVDHLTNLSLSPALLQTSIDEAMKRRNYGDSKKEHSLVLKELAALQKKIERWNTAFENGAIEVEDLMQRTKDLREKRKSLESHLAELEVIIEQENNALISAKDIITQIKNFHTVWQYASADEQRILIGALVDRVIVHDADNFEVILNI